MYCLNMNSSSMQKRIKQKKDIPISIYFAPQLTPPSTCDFSLLQGVSICTAVVSITVIRCLKQKMIMRRHVAPRASHDIRVVGHKGGHPPWIIQRAHKLVSI